jgi:NAD(P)H-hydrate epimerase
MRKKFMSERIITLETVKNIIERRSREIHKGDCGRILIAAGSWGMAGAAVLAARGALRAGSGLVQLAVPEKIFPIVQTGVIEATCLSDDLSAIDWSRYDAAAIGPGLGTGTESIKKVKDVLNLYDGPLIIDADELNVLAALGEAAFDKIRHRPAETIITPHIGEARRLMGVDYDPDMPRGELAMALAARIGAITVLKGAGTVVALPDGVTYTNTTGNPGMAVGGSGDILAGIIASLVGQHISPLDAAACGVWLHGRAGDICASEIGQYGMLPSDMLLCLPRLLK